MEGKTKPNNRLWQARHRIGLEQKQVARLLGHKTTDQISRYERGARLPGLNTACKLTIIYGASLQELFPEHFERFNQEIKEKADAYSASLVNGNNHVSLENTDVQAIASHQPTVKESSFDAPLCHYARLLDKLLPSQTELAAIRKHITKLARAMAHL